MGLIHVDTVSWLTESTDARGGNFEGDLTLRDHVGFWHQASFAEGYITARGSVNQQSAAEPLCIRLKAMHWSLTQFTPATNNVAPAACHRCETESRCRAAAVIGQQALLCRSKSLCLQCKRPQPRQITSRGLCRRSSLRLLPFCTLTSPNPQSQHRQDQQSQSRTFDLAQAEEPHTMRPKPKELTLRSH